MKIDCYLIKIDDLINDLTDIFNYITNIFDYVINSYSNLELIIVNYNQNLDLNHNHCPINMVLFESNQIRMTMSEYIFDLDGAIPLTRSNCPSLNLTRYKKILAA